MKKESANKTKESEKQQRSWLKKESEQKTKESEQQQLKKRTNKIEEIEE